VLVSVSRKGRKSCKSFNQENQGSDNGGKLPTTSYPFNFTHAPISNASSAGDGEVSLSILDFRLKIED
jgi:hypothetical protein